LYWQLASCLEQRNHWNAVCFNILWSCDIYLIGHQPEGKAIVGQFKPVWLLGQPPLVHI